MSSLKFGTSGLRGLVTDLTDSVCMAYTRAFLQHMQGTFGTATDATVLVGYDLRSSSRRIAGACMAAITDTGMKAENCGPLPTPALALRAMRVGVPAIMVTGSHIPDDRNGLKFYRPDGEIDKADEAGILAVLDVDRTAAPGPAGLPAISPEALQNYMARGRAILGKGTLTGKRIGVYQHSSVARDVLVDLLANAGATVVAIGRSDVFIPVDTEALRPEDVDLAAAATNENSLDALVSTDGDADRPLIADEHGNFLRGDSVGLLTTHFLGADAVVTPVTSNTAIELCGLFKRVYRTKVGSPYVIEGMQRALKDGYHSVVGFEANGGVLLGSPADLDGYRLDALPTRDAVLPVMSVLGMAARTGSTISQLLGRLPSRFTRSGRLEHVPATASGPFLQGLLDGEARERFFAEVGTIRENDSIDGVRVVLASGEVIHFRASGNAPELRCYAEASSDVRAEELLAWGLRIAATAL
ncbi:phosphomannomutase [Phyllobacterium pellucidum]|uniref:phosphomannomutase n=1 Tax=Phyllobacterium pellucidum TaxID=2740464 RepID=UPI001D135E76|nr:phosphomannomutase [Phyllobacterium sp. T1018]UGY10500.1 phosphomannomutase [Phyllobacterium sp. T1018]